MPTTRADRPLKTLILAIFATAFLALPGIAVAEDCVNVRTGESVGCDELGAVTQEIYDENLDEPAEEEAADDSSPIPIIAGAAGLLLISGGAVFLLRRRRKRVGADPAESDSEDEASGGSTPAAETSAEPATETPDVALPAPRQPSPPVPPPSGVAAGWYPDPTQVKTQRYWTGSEWTDQRAPLEEKSAGLRFGVILVMFGALVTIIGVFLPWVGTSTLIPIQDNTLIQGGDGWLPLLGAVGAAAAAYASRAVGQRNWAGVILGLLIIGYAIYAGTGERVGLVTGAGEQIAGSPGIGLFVVGAGGFLITLGSIVND